MNTRGNEKFLSITNSYLSREYCGKLFPPKTIVFPKNGGAVFTNKKRVLTACSLVDLNTGTYTASTSLDFDYSFCFFSTIDFKRLYKGTALPTIDNSVIERHLLPFPPLEEQKRIIMQIDLLLADVEKIDADAMIIESFLSLTKQKILDLAIRGKLIPQNPDDEPASELLKKIMAEKESLIQVGKIKRDKRESFIFRGDDNRYYEQVDGETVCVDDEIPFEIPSSWAWTRLLMICDYGTCSSEVPEKISDTAWILDLEDIERDTGRLLSRVMKKDRNTTSAKHKFLAGNVLYSKLRTYLNKVLVADEDGFCTSEILPLDFGSYVVPDYARSVLMSQMFLEYTAQCGYGVKMPRLGTSDGRKAWFPLPPVNEQRRIIEAIENIVAMLENLG